MSTFELVAQGPFDLSITGSVFETFAPLRHQPGLGADGVLRFGFVLDGAHVPVAVALRAEGARLRGEVFGTDEVATARDQVARILSLDHDGTGWPELGERDPDLGALQRALSWLRPVGFTSPYECACWAVVSQRISRDQAARVVARLVEAHGHHVATDTAPLAVFPDPQRVLESDALTGVPEFKLRRLRAVADAALQGRLDAASLRAPNGAAVEARLREIPGIGPFWAAGIRLRAGGVHDEYSFDRASLRALAAAHGRATIDPATAVRLAEAYRPYRMWACFLHRVACNRGLLAMDGERRSTRASATERASARPVLLPSPRG